MVVVIMALYVDCICNCFWDLDLYLTSLFRCNLPLFDSDLAVDFNCFCKLKIVI